MKTVAVIGANGQLGIDLINVLKKEEIPFMPIYHRTLQNTEVSLDITDHETVRREIELRQPEAVINTAAFHKVDQCEDEIEKAFQTNSFGVRNLAEVCRDNDIKLVHLSTDYVFDGSRENPYAEEVSPNPLSVYGNSKFSGEIFIRNILKKHFIIRTAALQGLAKSSVKGGNFVESMLKLAQDRNFVEVVDDQITTPTYTRDLAEKIVEVMKTDNYGTYHITNSGECSWYEFAKKIFKLNDMDIEVRPIDSEEAARKFKYKAKRPAYSVLDNLNLRKTGLDDLRHWEKALEAYLVERKSKNEF